MIPHIRITGSQNSGNIEKQKCSPVIIDSQLKTPCSSIQGFWGLLSPGILGSFPLMAPSGLVMGNFFSFPWYTAIPHLHSVSSHHLKLSSALFCEEKASPYLQIQLNSVCFGKPSPTAQAGLYLKHNIWFIVSVSHCFMTTYVSSTCIWCPSPNLRAPNTGPRIHLTSNRILILPSNC